MQEDRVTVNVELAASALAIQRFVDKAFDERKEKIDQLIQQELSNFDYETEIKNQVRRYLSRKVEEKVNLIGSRFRETLDAQVEYLVSTISEGLIE